MKPKLTLRDLFGLTLVVGLALGWWLDHRRSSEAYTNLQMQWLYSIPPPYPKKEVEIEMLETENAQLRAKLKELEQQVP